MQMKHLIGCVVAATFAVGSYAQGGAAGTPDSAAGAGSATMSTSPSQEPQSVQGSPSSATWGSSSSTVDQYDAYSSRTGMYGADYGSIHDEPRGSQLPGSLGEGEATRTPEIKGN